MVIHATTCQVKYSVGTQGAFKVMFVYLGSKKSHLLLNPQVKSDSAFIKVCIVAKGTHDVTQDVMA